MIDRLRLIMAADRSARISGLETHMAGLSQQLAHMGHDVTLVFPRIEVPPLFDEARSAGVHVVELEKSKWLSFIKTKAPTLFHAHTYGASLFGLTMTKHIQLPVVVTVHGPAQHIPPTLTDRRFAERHRFGLIRVSEEPGASFHVSPSVTIENGIDLQRFSPPSDLSRPEDDTLRLLYVGRVGPKKKHGVTQLAEAVQQLPKIHMQYAATWTPDGQSKAVTDPAPLFRWADVVVSTGRGIREGMASGAACIVLGTVWDGLVTPENVIPLRKCNFSGRATSTPPSQTDMIGVLKRLLHNRSLLDELGQFGIQYAADHFCIQDMAEQTVAFYQSLLR